MRKQIKDARERINIPGRELADHLADHEQLPGAIRPTPLGSEFEYQFSHSCRTSHGLSSGTPVVRKSATLRVTIVMP